MKESPILFNGEMVRAILEGRKTQTRRVIKNLAVYPNRWVWKMDAKTTLTLPVGELIGSPFGKPGDHLWVRETWAPCDDAPDGVVYRSPPNFEPVDFPPVDKWKPSIHMPKWASRITLKITDIRVEKLQDISEEDCCAEGIGSPFTRDCKKPKFKELWQSINGPDSWDSNPWVWVIEFERAT